MKKSINLVSVAGLLLVVTVILGSCTKQKGLTPADASQTKLKANSSSIGNIVDIDISLGDSVYYWSKSGYCSSGTYDNSTYYRSPYSYSLPSGYTPNDVVGIGIASNNHCFYWYSDGTYTEGTSNVADYYAGNATYTCPYGESPTTIVAMSIAKQGSSNVYTWYKDGTATVGTPYSLDAVRSNYTYYPASGKSVFDIVGIGIQGSDDHTFAWYNDGLSKTVSSGYTNQLDVYFSPAPASF